MAYSIVMKLCFSVALLNAALVLLVQQPETMSLLEKPLYAPPLSKKERSTREEALAEARAAYARDRTNVDAAVALSQAQMALGHVGDSLELLTRALEDKPDDPRLRLERGRGLAIIRKFELAVRELRTPAETLPEASCALGVAEYLTADYAHAREAFSQCPEPGILSYLADLRSGSSTTPPPIAPPAADGSGKTKKDSVAPLAATYQDAVERLVKKDTAGARELLKKIVEKDRHSWMNPVYIAAEADYAKILKAEGKKHKAKRKN